MSSDFICLKANSVSLIAKPAAPKKNLSSIANFYRLITTYKIASSPKPQYKHETLTKKSKDFFYYKLFLLDWLMFGCCFLVFNGISDVL